MRLMVLLFFSSFAFAQQSSTTTAPCSPIAPDNTGTITINCPGMSKEQGEKMAAILNKIQAKQLDLDSIMTALAEINDKTPKLKGVLLPANDPPQPFDCGGRMAGQIRFRQTFWKLEIETGFRYGAQKKA